MHAPSNYRGFWPCRGLCTLLQIIEDFGLVEGYALEKMAFVETYAPSKPPFVEGYALPKTRFVEGYAR